LSEEPSLEKIVLKYFSEVDLVLAEGFKRSNVPHLLIAHSMSALLEVPHLIAVVSKIIKRSDSKKISYFTPNQTNSIADFIEERFLR
jgi:molybdopterin-guanine dinucleotide biosynthesis protein MobB